MLHQKAFEAVEIEMARSETAHGPLTKDTDRAMLILAEEFGEAAKAALELNRGQALAARLQEELIQTAATALLMWENLNKE